MRKNKIRILHVAQAAGGVDRYIRMLLKYLDKEKFENILVCSQDFHEEDYRDLVDSFEQVEMTRAIGGNDLKAIKEVRTLIKKYNPDIVYAHSSKAGAIARVADIGLKNHCVYNPHGWAFNMRCSAKKKAMYTAIEKVAAPFCDKIICISDAEKQSALDKKICREDKLQVIFNGVDIESYENGVHGAVKRKDLNIPEDAFVVGMVGRMSPQKAPDENRILQYFGRISLIVLCIHGPVYRVVVKIISIPLHMGTDAVREKFLLAMLVMIVTMVICSLAYEIIVRVAPWMIGKKKVKVL